MKNVWNIYWPLVMGSMQGGVVVPFPEIDRRPGEPKRVRLAQGGRLFESETHCPSKYVNFSLDGQTNVLLPHLIIKQSEVFAPGCNPGKGVFAAHDMTSGTVTSEYGGEAKTYKEVKKLRATGDDTHVNACIRGLEYLDSKFMNGNYPAPGTKAPGPPVRLFLQGHYLAGFMNSAYYQYDCNCEFVVEPCQPREDMPGLTHSHRLFARLTRNVAAGEELLVHYGHNYFRRFKLPRVPQPGQPESPA